MPTYTQLVNKLHALDEVILNGTPEESHAAYIEHVAVGEQIFNHQYVY